MVYVYPVVTGFGVVELITSQFPVTGFSLYPKLQVFLVGVVKGIFGVV